MIEYLRTNARHVNRTLREWCQCRAIEWFAERWRRNVEVPQFDERAIESLRRPDSILSGLLALDADAAKSADEVLGGRMRVLSRTLDFEDGLPEWHRDYINGGSYALRPYPLHDVVPGSESDIVAVWELSRLQFAPCLVQAYRSTKDQRYADSFYRILAHWDAANPYLMGVNWACGLDIAVRALQIALALVYLPAPSDARLQASRRLLWLHLLYLQQRDLYEPRATVNNHHLVALALHFAILHLFAGETAQQWRERARSHVRDEVLRQFRSDGGNIESAMQYHQFSLEAALLVVGWVADCGGATGSVATRTGLGEDVLERLHSASRFSADCCRVWGSSPRVGDSSDARVLIHRDYMTWHPADAGYLADWTAAVFGEADPFADASTTATMVYRPSGVGLHQSDSYNIIVLAMPVMDRAGGHNHYDKGSVLLRVAGRNVLVDSGTYCYTSNPQMRAVFRCGRAHNVLLVDGLEQAVGPGGGIFDTPRFGRVSLGTEQIEGCGAAFFVQHDGYAGRNGIGMLGRKISCLPREIVIEDRVEGQGLHRLEIVFNLAPGLSAIMQAGSARIDLGDGWSCLVHAPPGFVVTSEAGCFSGAYMNSTVTARLIFTGNVEPPRAVVSRIELFKSCEQAYRVDC